MVVGEIPDNHIGQKNWMLAEPNTKITDRVLAGPHTEVQNNRLRKQILAEPDIKIQATETDFFLFVRVLV